MERKLTCIVCPKGCELTVRLTESGEIEEINGYACPRGKNYAYTECTAPVRTVTSTVRCKDGAVVPVKTSSPSPKAKMFEVMKEINSVLADDNVKIGDVIISRVANTDSDVVATANK